MTPAPTALVVAACLAGPAITVDGTRPPEPPAADCICTMEYDPVCARTPDGTERTFANPCQARCAAATIIRRGQC